MARPFRGEAAAGGGSEWLHAPYRPHLYTLKLERANDPLDADALWEEHYGGGAQIVEKRSQNGRYRLREALDNHRRVISQPDARGKRVPVRYVYTDIVVGINQRLWRRQLMIGADGLETLVHNLAFRHQEDFRNSLLPGREPRYVVLPRADLADHEVCFQFGYGIFVPGPNDQLEAELRIHTPAEVGWHSLPSWVFFQQGRQIERPAGLYAEQHFLLLAGPKVAGPIAAPGWFTHEDGYLLLTRNPSLGWQAFGDEEFVHFDSSKPGPRALMELRFTDATGQDAGKTLSLEIRPQRPGTADATVILEQSPSPPPPREQTDWGGTIIPGRQGEPGLTLLPDRRMATQYPYALLLEGIALPRIDGRQGIPGLKGWILWLDEDGDPINSPLSREQTLKLPALSATREQNVLHARPPGENQFHPVTRFPHQLRLANDTLEIIAPPLPERYLGILHLPHPLEILLDSRPLKLGRSNGRQAADRSQLVLNQLAQPESLRWLPGRKKPGRLGDIGLSRRHLQVQVEGDKLRVAMAEGKTPAYVLDENGKPAQTLAPDKRQVATLAPEGRFLVGNYLLKFVKTES